MLEDCSVDRELACVGVCRASFSKVVLQSSLALKQRQKRDLSGSQQGAQQETQNSSIGPDADRTPISGQVCRTVPAATPKGQLGKLGPVVADDW